MRGGLSQKQFSEKIGISLRAYQRYEHGERLPPFQIIHRISIACDINMNWIITGRGEKEPEENDLVVAINNLDYIFERGPDDLIDFIIKILNLAVSCFRLDVDSEEKSLKEKSDEFVRFLGSIINMVPTALQKFYESEIEYQKLLDQLESDLKDDSS